MGTTRLSAHIIHVRVRDAAQLFNSMDPSPFCERDLDKEAEEFIVGWARELPRRAPLGIHIHLSQPPAQADVEAYIREGLHNYFAYRMDMTGRRFRELMARGRLSLIIGLVFLAACLWGADYAAAQGTGTFLKIAGEGLVIAGWVAMWRPMQIFLYEWWPLLGERRIYARLHEARVKVMMPRGKP